MDQPKFQRLLRIMKILTGNTVYTIGDIAQRLEISERTVYRYIDTFREAGFIIKKDGDIFRLDKDSPHFKDINNLLHFSEEEAYILKMAIESIDETHIIKQNLKKKLYTLYNYKIMAESVVKGKIALNVNALTQAIEQKKQVILKGYSSAHSKEISDRLVEPFAFTTNYIQVWAYDTVTKENKLFKISRIHTVEIYHDWQFEEKHSEGFIDIFRMTSNIVYPVTLKLSLRAASLLVEEYPLAERELVKVSYTVWILETKVASFWGIGRFVMGLPHEIQVLQSDDFKHWLKEQYASIETVFQ